VAALIDTNILVYRFDSRFPRKQEIATRLLRDGLSADSLRIPHQALIEFMAVVTHVQMETGPLLVAEDARCETEELLSQFKVLYPNESLFRIALRRAATYQLPWFDAHIWAYAEHCCLKEHL
jgi:predicted nucleic acid-binding protein